MMLKRTLGVVLAAWCAVGFGVPVAAERRPAYDGGKPALSFDATLQRHIILRPRPAALDQARPWMAPDVALAWNLGYRGQTATITVIDDFAGDTMLWGNLTGVRQVRSHGEWTAQMAGMLAPGAQVMAQEFTDHGMPMTVTNRFDVVNLSYGIYARRGAPRPRWGRLETSILNAARNGTAVVVKAAGNDASAVSGTTWDGQIDYLNADLVGRPSAVFVGALAYDGTLADPAPLAAYSNFAGSNRTVQAQFLVVGVDSDITGLSGTSFAAPTVAGYAAILSSKFRNATPNQLAQQLLSTARQDTIDGYDVRVHGQGEASLTRALAPRAIR